VQQSFELRLPRAASEQQDSLPYPFLGPEQLRSLKILRYLLVKLCRRFLSVLLRTVLEGLKPGQLCRQGSLLIDEERDSLLLIGK
jgi:hypothetical protein